MLGLPPTTEVNRRVAKDKFYANANLTPRLREVVKDRVESVFWRNKLSASTFNASAGENIDEIQVFEIKLRVRGLDKWVMTAIASAIPYKILFVLTFGEEAQVWMEASDEFYGTEWLPLNDHVFEFVGLNLDAVYENLARQLASGRLDSGDDLMEAVDFDRRRRKIEREIATLEKKMLVDKQFNRQVDLNAELKRLKHDLEELDNGRKDEV